jgi:hypothetical protein
MLIANRLLKLRDADKEVAIPIRIYAPQQKDEAWSCNYQIDWPEGTQTMSSWGIDSVQALILALQMIGADIYTSSYHKSGNLMFEAPGRGYGFPVAKSLRDLLVGDDAMNGA